MLFALSAMQHSQMERKLHRKPTDKAISAIAEKKGGAELQSQREFPPTQQSIVKLPRWHPPKPKQTRIWQINQPSACSQSSRWSLTLIQR